MVVTTSKIAEGGGGVKNAEQGNKFIANRPPARKVKLGKKK